MAPCLLEATRGERVGERVGKAKKNHTRQTGLYNSNASEHDL